MNNVLNEIIKIENDAKRITDEAETAKKELDSYIALQKENIEAECKAENEKVLAEEEKRLKEKADAELFKMEKAHKEKLEEFKNATVSKRKKWSDEIFRKLIG